MFSHLLSLTRYAILIPVLGSWLAALLAMGFGAYEVLLTIANLITGKVDPEKVVKLSIINLVEAVDLFLLGTAFYLIALGLYELFIDEHAPVPAWLEIHDLDDLKNKLLSVIVVVLGGIARLAGQARHVSHCIVSCPRTPDTKARSAALVLQS